MSSKETNNNNKSKKRKADAAIADDDNDDDDDRNNNIADNNSSNNSKKPPAAVDRLTLHDEIDYKPLTMQDIYDRIQNLCRRIPPVPESGFLLPENNNNNDDDDSPPAGAATASSHDDDNDNNNNNNNPTLPVAKYPCRVHKTHIREWATAVQTVLEEFHLLVSCVSPATYTNQRIVSGAADQNLAFLSADLVRSQEQILARVTPRLNDVCYLCFVYVYVFCFVFCCCYCCCCVVVLCFV